MSRHMCLSKRRRRRLTPAKREIYRRQLKIEQELRELRLRVSSCAKAAVLLAGDDRVSQVSAENDILTFETHWIKSDEILGNQYYIGRFRATLQPSNEEVCVVWLEKGCSPTVHPRYKIYSDRFCFGVRKQFLDVLISTDEYIGAAYGILDSLSHVNPIDIEFVIKHYRKVEMNLKPEDKELVECLLSPHRAIPR